MSTKKQNDILRALARILLAFVFLFGQTAWARQDQNGKDKLGSKPAAKSQPSPTKASTSREEKAAPADEDTATEGNSSSAENSQRGGPHEGIQVHGHWTIEVRNPDGSVVSHREFENSLAAGEGSMLLTSILGRLETVGAWEVVLDPGVPSDPNQPQEITIDEAGSAVAAVTAKECSVTPSTTSCSANLAVSSGSSGGSLVLAGSAVVPPTGSVIGYVETRHFGCPPAVTPQACPANPPSGFTRFTSRPLDGLNGDPARLPVSPGQTVAVTVTISFS
jgi:hypothetical protein